MLIRFHGPFATAAGGEIRIEIGAPLSLAELIALLPGHLSGYASRFAGEAELSAQMLFFRGGKILKLADLVENGDTVEMLLPVSGG